MSTPADSIYQLIKQNESHFPLPAPYFTINMGTFDAAAGSFVGLTTTVDFDPEPIEHLPNQKIINPPPHFQETTWVSTSINNKWQRTTTTNPAPKAPLAPVLLHFTIKNATSTWSVVANGVTTTAPASQSTLTVGIWDSTFATWSVQAGGKSHGDVLKIQRPAGVSGYGVGAFTIPILPVSIVYSPPTDSLNKSSASYLQAQTIGTTVTNSFSNDSSTTGSNPKAEYGGVGDFLAGLGAVSTFLSSITADPAGTPGGVTAADVTAYGAASKLIGVVSTEIGKFSATLQTGVLSTSDNQITATETTTDTLVTVSQGGGPGAGDILHFLKNIQMAWSLLNGQLRLCPLGYADTSVTVAGLAKNFASLGVSAADAEALLALDPFVAGGAQVALPADRFTFVKNIEYGFDVTYMHIESFTRDTKNTSTTKNYTTSTSEWDAGPIFQLLGFGGKSQTTTSISNATGSDVSNTVTMSVNLTAGPTDHFIVNLFYDNLFGTFAFQQEQVPSAAAPRVEGAGALAGQSVTLIAGAKSFTTVADAKGQFAFHSPRIPPGAASLTIGSQPTKTVMVAAP